MMLYAARSWSRPWIRLVVANSRSAQLTATWSLAAISVIRPRLDRFGRRPLDEVTRAARHPKSGSSLHGTESTSSPASRSPIRSADSARWACHSRRMLAHRLERPRCARPGLAAGGPPAACGGLADAQGLRPFPRKRHFAYRGNFVNPVHPTGFTDRSKRSGGDGDRLGTNAVASGPGSGAGRVARRTPPSV